MRNIDELQSRLHEISATNIDRYDEKELHFDVNGHHVLVLADHYNSWLRAYYYQGNLISNSFLLTADSVFEFIGGLVTKEI
jgi:hypothetical protein